jgi:nucleoside 2-deoxyribosyltransferase
MTDDQTTLSLAPLDAKLLAAIEGAMRLRVYIAGPMSAYWRDNYNAAGFRAVAAMLADLGFDCVSPHDLDLAAGVELDREPGEFSDLELRAMMERDLNAIYEADAVFAFDMETESIGRSVEVAYARFIRRPVFTQIGDLVEWRAKRAA